MAKRKSQKKRSKFELSVQRSLKEAGVKFRYEAETYDLWDTVTGSKCAECGSKTIQKRIRYTPDWFLEHGVIIETKGIFTGLDRKKITLLRQQHGVEVKMLFMRDNKISRYSNTRYSDWCEQHGFDYAIGTEVPKEWV
jgi:hypothetical protein